MNNIDSMKQKEIDRISRSNERAIAYGDGYTDGYNDGYDKAVENMKHLEENSHSEVDREEKKTDSELFRAILSMNKNTRGQQLRKISDEMRETILAWGDGEKEEHIAERLACVQISCTVAMDKFGFSASQRKKIMKQVIENTAKLGDCKEEV